MQTSLSSRLASSLNLSGSAIRLVHLSYYSGSEDDGYFERSVMTRPDRRNIRREWCERALKDPEYTEVEPGGRIRRWIYVAEAGKYLRVVTLEDGETVHNALFDRTYARKRGRGAG